MHNTNPRFTVALLSAVLPFSTLVLAACGSEDNVPTDGASDAGNENVQNESDQNDDDDEGNGRVEALALIAGGDADAVTLTEVYRAPPNLFCETQTCPGLAVDLEFNPAREGELWVVFRRPYNGEPCSEPPEGGAFGPEQAGCTLLRSMVAVIEDATSDEPQVALKEDGNSLHFMRLATSLAFADDDTFATVGEARTGNWLDQPPDFMGPTWWSSDPEIFAQDFMRNGSHLDMLHATSFGMGIAHQRDHVFWCFNGQFGSIDRYDFKEPHEPGGEYHGDGEYHRYAVGQVERMENVPSHLAFADDERTLFIVDSGNGRIVKFDTEQDGEMVDILTPDPQLTAPKEVRGTDIEQVVAPGVLRLPSGLAIHENHLFVSDTHTSLIHMFDLDGDEVASLDTGLDRNVLAGMTVGPDNKLYLVDWPEARVLRIDVD